MAETILDRLDADPGGARKYIAALYAYGGTHEQVAQKLAEKFGIRQPSKRIVGEWRRNDEKLIALIEELEEVRRDMNPDASPADVLANVPAPVDPAEASGELFDLTVKFPAFANLLARPDDEEFDGAEAMRQVLAAEHDSDEAFEAACAALVGDWNPHVPTPGAGSLAP